MTSNRQAMGSFLDGVADAATKLSAFFNVELRQCALLLGHEMLMAEHATMLENQRRILARQKALIRRQLEVIRLLHTPQGQRQTDVPACGGGPCDWPEKPKK